MCHNLIERVGSPTNIFSEDGGGEGAFMHVQA